MRITLLPKSGCAMHSATRKPAINTCGRKPTEKLRMRSDLLGQRVGQPQDQRQLGDLGGLHVDRTHLNPARRAASVVTEAEDDEQEQAHRERQHGLRERAVAVVVEARQDHQEGKPMAA